MANEYLIYYNIALGVGGLFCSAFFLAILNQNDDWRFRGPAYKFTAALTFLSVSVATQVLDSTWTVNQLVGMHLPSLQTIFNATVIAFMISGLWDIWNLEA